MEGCIRVGVCRECGECGTIREAFRGRTSVSIAEVDVVDVAVGIIAM